MNHQAIVSNIDRLCEKADLCAIIFTEFPDETMYCSGDHHENGVMDMNISRLQGCDRRIDGEGFYIESKFYHQIQGVSEDRE
jgi:hypothetical protein